MPEARCDWEKTAISGLLIAATAIGLNFIPSCRGDPLYRKERKAWKATAISEINHRIQDRQWLESELAKVKKQVKDDEGEWCSENLAVATNGEWIVCASKCAKENPSIYDIFIGHGSDGKWYYSTYHFCVGKLVLKMDERPGSLSEFVQTYYLEEFDGRSDECLRKTWPRKR